MGQEKLDAVDPAAIKAVGLFGGGIARTGNVCGALVGAIAAVSSIYSRGALDDKEDPVMWELGARLVRRFEELAAPCAGIRCQDIARVDFTDPVAVAHFRNDPGSRRSICTQLVGDMARVLGELIEEWR